MTESLLVGSASLTRRSYSGEEVVFWCGRGLTAGSATSTPGVAKLSEVRFDGPGNNGGQKVETLQAAHRLYRCLAMLSKIWSICSGEASAGYVYLDVEMDVRIPWSLACPIGRSPRH